jgi:hypothetical protein
MVYLQTTYELCFGELLLTVDMTSSAHANFDTSFANGVLPTLMFAIKKPNEYHL